MFVILHSERLRLVLIFKEECLFLLARLSTFSPDKLDEHAIDT